MESQDSLSVRAPRGILAVLAVALAVGAGYFAVTLAQLMRAERIERAHLVEITNAFTEVYSDFRGAESPVPATFRRAGIEHFSTGNVLSTEDGVRATIRMPGVPGQEIETVEQDPRIASMITEMAKAEDGGGVVEEHRLENGRFIGRTLVPSVASQESCVACHNEIFGGPRFELGDVMGAFVLESDLTEATREIAVFTVGAFVVALISGLFLARRERVRSIGAIDALRARVRAERERREAEAHAAYLASHDALTGLANRADFRERISAFMANPSDGDLIVTLVDLDDFKIVNDTLGHATGDALLKEIAGRIKSATAELDGLAARLGGDEFASTFIAAPGCDLDRFGAQLIETLNAPVHVEGSILRPGASMGIARWSDTGGDADQLLQAADAALYAAKNNGKNLHRVFDRALAATMGRRAAMARDLSEAIASDELSTAYQPLIELRTGRLLAFEALARWTWRGETVSPEEFVPVAESNQLIRDLDLSTLRQGARFVADLRRRTGVEVSLSSNLSATNLRDPNLADNVRGALRDAGLEPQAVTLELTESVFMDNWSDGGAILAALQDMGMRIALDDFGTGFSALSYLTDFPFDTIKLDRSFIEKLDQGSSTLAVSAHVVQLAATLNKTVVVEGLQTEEHVALMEAVGAHVGQGFYYARPLPADRAIAFAEANFAATTKMPLKRRLAM